MPKYKVQFELRTEGLDAPVDLYEYPPWRVVNRDTWINLTEILTVHIEADSANDARAMVKETYSKAFDIYVRKVN